MSHSIGTATTIDTPRLSLHTSVSDPSPEVRPHTYERPRCGQKLQLTDDRGPAHVTNIKVLLHTGGE
eukprot:8237511-Pyramimonas_sp.AAC.1